MTAIADIVRAVKSKTNANGDGLLDGQELIEAGRVVELSALDPNWHPMVQVAINAARNWQARRREQIERGELPNASLILAASQILNKDGSEDLDRTGKGVGKTHIALSVLWSIRQYVEGEIPVAPVGTFYKANDLIHKLERDARLEKLLNYRSHWDQAHSKMVVSPPPMIVIDDVGSEEADKYFGNRWQDELQRRYFRLIDHCDGNGISVIITSNLPLPPMGDGDPRKAEGVVYLDDVLGGRAWSRLQEMCPRGFIVDMTGARDYRRKAGGR